MTPLATYFSKSRLMARFQSHHGVYFYEKQEFEDVIGDLEVPDDVLFFCGNGHLGAIETEPSA